jgi:hypothetical protein
MTQNSEDEIRRIYEEWHRTVRGRDLEGLVALYDERAILETPLILATLKDRSEGILRGMAEIRPFFEAGLSKLGSTLARWFRKEGAFFSDGRQLVWEYPRETPEGDQIDLVEVMDIAGGLIRHHRVYWGWVGYKSLVALSGQCGEF